MPRARPVWQREGMDAPDAATDPLSKAWVVSILLDAGDPEAVINAEGLLRSTLYDAPEGPQPVVSEVRRFVDLSPLAQQEWRLAVERTAED